jgi:hypothetical protein
LKECSIWSYASFSIILFKSSHRFQIALPRSINNWSWIFTHALIVDLRPYEIQNSDLQIGGTTDDISTWCWFEMLWLWGELRRKISIERSACTTRKGWTDGMSQFLFNGPRPLVLITQNLITEDRRQ